MTQYSIHPKRSAIRAQAAYFLLWTMPSVTFLRLSDISVICRVTYFQFPIQSAFLPCISRQAAPELRRTISFNTQCRALDVYCTGHTAQKKEWIILTVKMETIHPVEGQFCSEFPAICSHRGVTTAWSRETWKFCEHFCVCKRPLTVKCLKFWSQSFYRFTDRRCCVQMS